jgi:hypothetical protein
MFNRMSGSIVLLNTTNQLFSRNKNSCCHVPAFRLDPNLCGITTSILLQSLRECPPLSLRDPADCLNGLGTGMVSTYSTNQSRDPADCFNGLGMVYPLHNRVNHTPVSCSRTSENARLFHLGTLPKCQLP